MKKLQIYLTFVLFFSILSQVPANAVFGLSKCEKVKKELLSLENSTLKYQRNIRGNNYTNNISGYDEKIFILTDDGIRNVDLLNKLNPIPVIWKLAYNNPKCFTNTQNLRVQELGKLTTEDFASYKSAKKYQYTDYCKGAGSYFTPNKKKFT